MASPNSSISSDINPTEIVNGVTEITAEDDGDPSHSRNTLLADGNTGTGTSLPDKSNTVGSEDLDTEEYVDVGDRDEFNKKCQSPEKESEPMAEKFEAENLEKKESSVHVQSMNGGFLSELLGDDNSDKLVKFDGDDDKYDNDINKSDSNDRSHELLQNVLLDQMSSDEGEKEKYVETFDAANNAEENSVTFPSQVMTVEQSPQVQLLTDEEDKSSAHDPAQSVGQGGVEIVRLPSPVLSDKSPSVVSVITESDDEAKQGFKKDNLVVSSDDDSLEKVTPIEDSKWQFTESTGQGEICTDNDMIEGSNEEISLKQLIDRYDEVNPESIEELGQFATDGIISSHQRDESTSVMSNLTDYNEDGQNEFRSTDNEQSNPTGGSQSSDNLSSKYPEYPDNYNGYKVCRDVAPGVKECLILETGETSAENCSPGSLENTSAANNLASNKQQSPDDRRSQISPNHSPSQHDQALSSPPSSQSKFKIRKPILSETDIVCKNLEFDSSENEKIISSQNGDLENESGDMVSHASDLRGLNDGDFRSGSPDQVIRMQDKNKESISDNNNDTNTNIDQVSGSRGINLSSRNVLESSSDSEPLYHSQSHHAYQRFENYPGQTSLNQHLSASDMPNSAEYTDVPRHMTYGTSKYSGGVYVSQPYGMSSNTVVEAHKQRDTRKLSPRAAVSSPSTGPVPGYNSLQEQQTSWLQMFRTLEEQHNKELKWQYKQHRLTIDKIQEQLERDLKHQQNMFTNRLDHHKEALETTKNSYSHLEHGDCPPYLKSYGTRAFDVSEGYAEDELTDADDIERLRKLSKRSPRADRSLGSDAQSFHVDYLPSTRNILKSGSKLPSTSLPVKRSLEHEFSSPYSSPEPESRSYRHQPQADDSYVSGQAYHHGAGGDLPRAGVYSTPMPSVANRHLTKASELASVSSNMYSMQNESPPRSDTRRNRELHDERIIRQTPASRNPHNLSLFDDVSLSPNTRTNLREKHAKHLADLRSYYEEEIQDLRTALNSCDQSRMQADQVFLETDNKRLKKKSVDLENQLDDAQIQIRELEQKLLGLESRSGDYACMYRDSQGMVIVLEKRIDELEEYCQEKDVRIKELETRVKQQTLAFQETKRTLESQEENSRRDQATMKRLVEKYEGLEKEYKLLQNTATATEEKLFETRNEIVEINRVIAKVELENKRLNRENDCLRSRIKQSTGLSLPNGYHTESGPSSANHDRHNFDARSFPREEVDGASEELPEEDDYLSSPLLMAERELMKIRQKMYHHQSQMDPPMPKLQKKFYGSEISNQSKNTNNVHVNSTASSLQNTPTKNRLRDKNVRNSPSIQRKSKSPKVVHRLRDKSKSPVPSSRKHVTVSPVVSDKSSPMRFDVPWDDIPNNERHIMRTGQTSCPISIQNHSDSFPNKNVKGHGRGSSKVQSTLDKVKAGEYVSRPDWEDIHTSMAKPKKSAAASQHNKLQENRLQDRLKSIGDLEKHYDDLQAEKRNIESLLTKIPVTGRVDRQKKKDKEDLEEKLDQVQHELGSVRMSLKRFNVLKTSGY